MSEQCRFLKNVIETLQANRSNEASIAILRKICAGAAEAAPVDDLIAMSLFVLDLGTKARRDQASQN